MSNLAQEMESIVEQCTTDVKDHSLAAQELASPVSPHLLEVAFGQGTMLSVAVRDHFQALIRSLTEPVLTIAPWSNARSTLESAALSCWLFDPGIDAKERVSRSLAFRYEGLCRQTSLARKAEDHKAVARTTRRLDQIILEAKALGYTEVLTKNRKRAGIGQRMPTLTLLAETVLGKGATYSILSAMVHAHPWAMQRLGFRTVHDGDGSPMTTQGRSGDLYFLQKDLPIMAVKFIVAEAGDAFCETHLREWTFFGRDLTLVEAAQNRFEGELRK